MEDGEAEAELLQLADLLSQSVDWLVGKVQGLLPDVDLTHILQMTDDRGKVFALIQELSSSHTPAWRQLLQCVYAEYQLPLALEVWVTDLLGTDSHQQRRESAFQSEDEIEQRIQESAAKYREQIRSSILEKYGFKTTGDPRGYSNPMFVEPLIKEIKMPRNKQRPRFEQNPGSTEASDTEIISRLFGRTSFTETHVTLLIGMPGTGKTMMAQRICYQWAQGKFNQYTLTFLFEFRQLNLISRYLTLKELLFSLFLMPDLYSEEVFNFVIKHPEKVLIIFDGLDEFDRQFAATSQNFEINVDQMTSMSKLFDSILYGTILQGCTIMITCRSKLLNSLPLNAINQIAEVVGFNKERVEQYIDSFFGMNELKDRALLHLRDNNKLMHMCFVPALCHIVCICLEDLLNSSSMESHLPQTITQFYVEILNIFIQKRQSSCMDQLMELETIRLLILDLARLAHDGLDRNKTIFYAQEISDKLKGFAQNYRLLVGFEVKRFESSMDRGYSFVHLSSQEFFAALFLMICGEITPDSLNKRLNLKSKWNLKLKTKEELIDNFHIFLSGLSSKDCLPFLHGLSVHSKSLVQKKQGTIQQSLAKLADTELTGPKIIELCHCIYETQDQKLADYIGKHLAQKYDLKNFRINPVDMTAIMFVVNYGSCLVTLDFTGCPMELECLEVLRTCDNIESLSFKSKKYGAEFAHALTRVIADIKPLKRFRLTAGCLTSSIIGTLMDSFLCCEALQEIILVDNHLKVEDMALLLKLFHQMKHLKSLDVSRNDDLNAKGVLSLLKSAVSQENITNVQMAGNIPTAIFSADSCKFLSSPQVKKARKETARKKEIKLSLMRCDLTCKDVPHLISILTSLHLSYLNLSGNPLGDGGCKQLLAAMPKMHISGELNLNETQISEEGASHLASCMQSCHHVKQVFASNLNQTASLHFITDDDDDDDVGQRDIRITGFTYDQQKFEKLSRILQKCRKLTHLDLSNNHLENAGISQLTQVLQHLKWLRSVDVSGNNISLGGILSLAEALSAVKKLIDVEISFGEHQKAILKFQGNNREQSSLIGRKNRSCHLPPSKTFSLSQYRMTSQKLKRILDVLVQCAGLTQLRLSNSALSYSMIANLMKHLPQLPNLTLLDISGSDLSPDCVLLLADSINLCPRITEVDVRSADNMYLHLQKDSIDKISCRFNSCRIGKNDVAPLMKILLGNPNLQEISMCMNHLSEDGILALLASVSSCTSITQITARLNPKEIVHIIFAPSGGSLKTISLSECSFQLEHVKKLCNLLQSTENVTKVKLRKSNLSQHAISDVLLALSQMSQDSILSIEEPWMESEALLSLVLQIMQSPACKTISICKRKMKIELYSQKGHQGGSTVLHSEGLKSLRLHHCGVDVKNVPLLSPLIKKCGTCISELDLSNNNLGDDGVQAVADLLTTLPSLLTIKLAQVNLSHIGLTTLTESLKHCRSVENIDLSCNNIGEKGAVSMEELLAQKKNFRYMNVSGCFLGTTNEGRQFIAELSKCPELQEIQMQSLSLDDISMLTLSHGLSHMPSLKILMLGNNKITQVGVAHLTGSLMCCPEMEALDLSGNNIGDAGAECLAALLPSLEHVKKMSLAQCNISSFGGIALARALGQCQEMEEINVSGNKFDSTAGTHIADVLPQMGHLKVLTLSELKLEEQSLLRLAEGVQHFTLLKTIQLKLCEISDSRCKSLAKALGCCQNLEEITLSWNSIGDEGSSALACAFRQTRKLKRVDLEQNQIMDQGAEAMAQALSICLYIKVVRLWHNPISRETKERLELQDPRFNFSFF
ncbi:protein NLRC5 [Hyperolius riggenbachi]|uniref:protein NLRC5 n=1 Tax=Hyperolius riggenbachi TaxID=752182 RepID=UPI0035A2E69F